MRGPRSSGRRASRTSLDVVAALDAALPPDRIVAADSTKPAYAANHSLPLHSRRSWLMPIGYGCLGCALPMAIGAKLAAPDRPVVALAGDGGVMFTSRSSRPRATSGSPLPIVVYDNSGYGEIRDAMDESGIPNLGTDVTTHDLPAIARGFGVGGVRVTTADGARGGGRGGARGGRSDGHRAAAGGLMRHRVQSATAAQCTDGRLHRGRGGVTLPLQLLAMWQLRGTQ